MKIAVYQFASTNVVSDNLSKIRKAIRSAAESNVRIIIFHECALCGYPPIESNIEDINSVEIENALTEIGTLARKYCLFIAVGTVRFENADRFNSIVLFDDSGSISGYYDKQALWGWDTENYSRGNKQGVFDVDNIKVGFRICFDVRFPELFRELYRQNTDICFVSFSDTGKTPDSIRYNIIKAHLITRAVENVMTVVSVNSISGFQTAPTAIFDCNGRIVKELPSNAEGLLIYDYIKPEMTFGMEGRNVNNNFFMEQTEALLYLKENRMGGFLCITGISAK